MHLQNSSISVFKLFVLLIIICRLLVSSFQHPKKVANRYFLQNFQTPRDFCSFQKSQQSSPKYGIHTSLYQNNENTEFEIRSKQKPECTQEYICLFVLCALCSYFFPFFLENIIDFTLPFSDRQNYIIALLIGKRIYIYSLGILAVAIVAKRSINSPSKLGERMMELNKEIFDPLPGNESQIEKKDKETAYKALDQIDGTTQALLLPVFLCALLLISFLGLGTAGMFSNLPGESTTGLQDGLAFFKDIFQSVSIFPSKFAPGFLFFSNLAVCFFFCKNELKYLVNASKLVPKEKINEVSAGLAGAITLLCVLSAPGTQVWSLQNFINVCIAVTVARALQLPRLPFIVLALTGVTVYDAVSVLGTERFTDGGASIMEAVARAKVSTQIIATPFQTPDNAVNTGVDITGLLQSVFSSSWKPGLFQVVTNGKVSDIFGLGDVVFPSMLVGWAFRFDSRTLQIEPEFQENTVDAGPKQAVSEHLKRMPHFPYFFATLFSYGTGCFICEIFQTGKGQPALLFIVPTMFIICTLLGLVNGQIPEMWEFGSEKNLDNEN